MTAKRVALYCRVSTHCQTTENQELELRAIAERQGWEIVKVYADHGISGARGRDQRPALDSMLKAATRGKFDIIATWSVDRLGRSLTDLCSILGELHALGVDLFIHQQGLNTTTPAGKAMFQMMGVFAEFERAIIRDRVNAGIARARKKGTRLGRPPIKGSLVDAIKATLAAGYGVRAAARALEVGHGTICRVRDKLSTP